MCSKILGILIFLVVLLPNFTSAATNQQNQDQYTQNIKYVDVNDPMVISVANFAVQQIGRGKLNSIILAQTAGIKDLIYILLLDLVDAHFYHNHYEVQVFVPANKSAAWQVIYYSAVKF